MKHCAFIYTPHLKEGDIRLCLELLTSLGVTITNLGKNDPPRRWNGDLEAAVTVILSGTDLTNYSFLSDSKARLEFDIQLHRDPRWESDTIALSGETETRLIEIARKLSDRLPCHAAIVGISGGGKDQEWQILRINPDCPSGLRSKFTNAGHVVGGNGG